MIQKLIKLLHYFGIDEAIFYTLLNRGFGIISGPITLYFIARFLSGEEQGYYYTFSSVLALQVFFELGLSFVIMQTVSHEMANLSWTENKILEGSMEAKSRIASLFRFALKTYIVIAGIAFCILLPVGFWFFSSKGLTHSSNVAWRGPWFIVVTITSLNLALTPFYGVLEGCGKVAEFAKRGSNMAIIGSICIWIALFLQFKLFSAPIQSVVCFIVGTMWVFGRYFNCFKDLLTTPIIEGAKVHWKKDILHFQWKVALSWVSGYFIFQLINPILFRYRGPVEAGQMGMSMRIIDSIATLGLSWVSTKSAPFGTYISKKDYKTLDTTFNKAARQSFSVVALGGCAFFAAYYLLRWMEIPIIYRFLGPLPLLFLLGNALVNCIIFGQAIYLRAHKEEPLLLNSIAGAIVFPIVLLLVAPKYGAEGAATAIFCINCFMGLPWCNWVFLRKKKLWHTAASEQISANKV